MFLALLYAVTASPTTVTILGVVAIILFVISGVVALLLKSYALALVCVGLAFLAGAVVYLT